jgi:1,4-alpha-glucan branching enzyme
MERSSFLFHLLIFSFITACGSDSGTNSSPDPDMQGPENAEVQDVPRPNGLKDGITYGPDGTSATLSLFAPNKDFVYLIGDFNDWEADDNYLMNREQVNADSTYWWIEIDSLEAGEEYGFQYLVDGELRVTDPYAELILDPNEDESIDGSVFPDLKPYPTGKTEFQVGVLQPGKEEFDFSVDDFQRPDPQELVIYELLVRDFTEAHSFNAALDRLDYLQELGVNAIELMPVMEFEFNESWGYNPAFHLALDKYYGTEDALKRFIDECHKRGIAVILDMVLNHAFGRSPLARLYSSGDFGPPTQDNPWLNEQARHPFNVGYDFNHESAATQYFVDRVNEYWLEEFKFDGFRFDLSKGFTQKDTGDDVAAWSQRDESRIRILKRMADNIWEADPDAYVILEHFAEASEETELAEYQSNGNQDGMFLWNNINREYNQLSMGYWSSDDFPNSVDRAWFGNTSFPVPNQISYMESHDEQWLMFRNISFGNSVNEAHDVKNLEVALERQKLIGALFFTIPGPKMLWQFGELGYGYGDSGEECLRGGDECPTAAPGRTAEKPVRWDYNDVEIRKDLYKTWAAVIDLRNQSEIFSDPTATQAETQLGEDLPVRWVKLSNGGTDALVIGNFDVESRSVDIPVSGEWYDYFTGESVNFQSENVNCTFDPAEFHILTTQPLEAPEAGITPDYDFECSE